MTINELRIGNYVFLDNDGFPEEITSKRLAILLSFPEKIDLINPIPLTTEILMKTGFAYEYRRWHKLGCVLDDSMYFVYLDSSHDDDQIIEIKSVHQLQNLYYALTGEELNIKL